MPKIIRLSKKFKMVCPACGCKFSFRQSEVRRTWEPIDQEKLHCRDYKWIHWVHCPECDEKVYLNIESDAE